jgi:DNA repair exonuclease SbcCD ATPase subunit
MIVFKTIAWKNFLSTGNSANKVNLNEHSTTLIVGKNGEGKSTILDALCFVLFNKPFRAINRPQLVNSINQKNCIVEIEFDIGPAQYKVVRGIKPAVFDIYLNGELINQDAAAKDYQKVLEQQILKLNYKTFTQVVILGSASFVPFMQLPTGQRREVIEDILDIKIFSTMNQLLKEKMVGTKDAISSIETEIRILTEQAKAQQTLLKALQNSQLQNMQTITSKIEAHRAEVAEHTKKISLLGIQSQGVYAEMPNEIEITSNLSKVQSAWTKMDAMVNQLDTNINFFSNNEVCPSCEQGIAHDHKEKIVSNLLADKETHLNDMKTIKSAQDKLVEAHTKLNDCLSKIKDINIEISTENSSIRILEAAIAELESELNQASLQTDIEPEKDKLKTIAESALAKNNTKVELQKEQKLQDIASVLLRDTGIKTSIIKEYLPAMNKLINKYLTAMDFFVKFELDESFNEKIKARFRDEFTYASFSEGEKMRIDLAILFTWRQIAKMKNSVNTNLLILDEIFDSSLDVAGTDYFLSVMNQLGENSNVFVISHKGDILLDKFKNNIRFVKHNDFSTISQNS